MHLAGRARGEGHQWWDADFKDGAAAAACRYRFKRLPIAPNEDGGRRHFALCVVVFSLAQLGAKAAVPGLQWFAPAAPWEKADFGSDDLDCNGLMHSDVGEIWLRDDIPNRRLIYVAAHEACHAVKHLWRLPSAENEYEAIAFGESVAGVFAVSSESPALDLFVRKTPRDLPSRAFPDSKAICLDDWGLYLNFGSLEFPRWRRHRNLAEVASPA